ncbi:hypothetical protein F4811DRAFT_547219 [Daldinia bambusicola]|nr:hypothetical protein F4811DRAFT_547219 [Daldinia bambusicola]
MMLQVHRYNSVWEGQGGGDGCVTEISRKEKKTYNTGYSLVVTDPTTNPAVCGLSMGERTGSRVFHILWSYVVVMRVIVLYITFTRK